MRLRKKRKSLSSYDVQVAEAILGRDAEEFLNSELGRYLLGRAQEEEQEALDKLARISSWRRNRIKELQAEVWRARSVRLWLAEIIQAGRQAETQLQDQTEEE